MVAWSDGVLAAFALISTLVATLRAGSRALYLIEHEHIDVMEGPLILGPADMKFNETLETSPLWELAQLFQSGVRLALDPGSMEYRVLAVETPQNEELVQDEPYSLSPFPVRKAVVDEGIVAAQRNATSVEDGLSESTSEDIVSSKSYDKLGASSSFISRVSPRNVFRRVPLLGSLMGRTDESDDETLSFDDNDFDEWDFAYCVSTDIPYNTTESKGGSAEITAYAPCTFADLRSRFGIPEQDFRQSILESGPYVSFQSNSKGAARVGGVFFFTRDGAYMIKTVKKEEARMLLKILPKYHKYMRRNSGRSLLTRFCGMYGVSLRSTAKSSLHKDDEFLFVVMNSVFPAAGSQFISERFDLKGSTVGRECSQEEKETMGKNAILKDLDLAREVELVRSLARSPSRTPEYGFHLGPTTKAALLSQLRRDVRLLANCGVMDYSLLVGVVHMDPHHLDNESMRALELSELQESRIELARRTREKKNYRERVILSSIVTPIRIMSAPPLFFGRRVWAEVDSIVSSILTRPLPYYGAGICGVNGGVFSILGGRRLGNRAIYFMGLIDFLQPWTTRKVFERRLKGILGYDTHAISCVPPEVYAARFLEYIDAHVS